MSDTPLSLTSRLERVQWGALVVGVVALVLASAGGFLALSDRGQFFRSYLVAYLALLAPAVGALALLLIHHLTGGGWGTALRPMLETATRTLPLLTLLVVPILLALPDIYPWARWTPEEIEGSVVLRHKALYLNAPAFIIRSVAYLIVWVALGLLVQRGTVENAEHRSLASRLSGPGLVLLGFTVTFAAIDWVMSLEPLWYSTVFGLLFGAGQVLAALSFAILCLVLIRGAGEDVPRPALHDLGNLLLTLVMIWAYMAFSQYLIIWSGNLPEEIPWYLKRLHGGWQVLALMLIALQFILPFLLLLSKSLKRDPRLLAVVAAAVLLMRVVDLYWMVTPAYFPYQGFRLHWMDAVLLVGVGGVWLAYFVFSLRRRPLQFLSTEKGGTS